MIMAGDVPVLPRIIAPIGLPDSPRGADDVARAGVKMRAGKAPLVAAVTSALPRLIEQMGHGDVVDGPMKHGGFPPRPDRNDNVSHGTVAVIGCDPHPRIPLRHHVHGYDRESALNHMMHAQQVRTLRMGTDAHRTLIGSDLTESAGPELVGQGPGFGLIEHPPERSARSDHAPLAPVQAVAPMPPLGVADDKPGAGQAAA